MKNINKIPVTDSEDPAFESLYESDAFVMFGAPADQIDHILTVYLSDTDDPDEVKMGGMKDDITAYIILGEAMNKHYHLRGDNMYPDDLFILAITLDSFNDLSKLAMFRIQVDPYRMKWYKDVVDNNRRNN